jgi:hypothetical protein
MRAKLVLLAALVSAGAAAQEDEKGVLVISPVAGGVRSARGAGGSYGLAVGYHREEGRFSYGVTALGAGGTWSWAGASLDGRWAFFDAPVSPYLGLGLGAFEIRRAGIDLGIRPAATAEAGLGFGRFSAGMRALVPLSSRIDGPRPHDDAGLSDFALFAQVGFRL